MSTLKLAQPAPPGDLGNVTSLVPPGSKPAKRRKGAPDWEAIERDYSANILTGDQMALKHGTSRVGILNKARKNGWRRDLAAPIQRSVARKLIEQAIVHDTRTVGNPHELVTLSSVKDDFRQVEAMANVTVGVILRHRSGIRDLQDIANGQLNELRAVTQGQDAMNLVMHAAAEGGIVDQDTLKQALKEVRALCALPARLSALTQLTNVYGALQTQERQAFGIKGDDNPEEEEDDVRGLLVGFVDAPYREAE